MEPDASCMTYALLIRQALKPPTEHSRLRGFRSYQFAPHITLARPLKSFSCWCEIEQIGNVQHDPWNPRIALELMTITQTPWEDGDDEAHGRAVGSTLSIHPRSHSPVHTLMHELAHIEMGHTYTNTRGSKRHAQREVEAELVATVCMAMLGAVSTEMVAVSRYYMHLYLNQMPEPLSATDLAKVNGAVHRIVTAGRC